MSIVGRPGARLKPPGVDADAPPGVLELTPGTRRGMPAIAEHVCQSCAKVTWGPVPARTDTMPSCGCGGRRQIVRIKHTAATHLDGLGLSAAERAQD